MDPSRLIAIDVHVHLEIPGQTTAADVAAEKYFGGGGAGRDGASLAEYYRSRRIGFVVFTVDEDLTGRHASATTTCCSLPPTMPISRCRS
jgi:hypothetical protein